MKRLFTSSLLLAATSLAQATPLYHPPGSNLSYGAVSNGQSIMSDITNPAAGAVALKEEGNQYRFGILSSIGFGFEFGKVDNIFDQIDAQADKFDGVAVDPNNIADTFSDDSIQDINDVLAIVGSDDAYAKVFFSGHVPFMPIVVAHEILGGSLVFDINVSLAAKVNTITKDIDGSIADIQSAFTADFNANSIQPIYESNEITLDLRDPFNVQVTIDNDSSIIAKGVTTQEIALGYSREIQKIGEGILYAGLRGKYYNVGLARAAIRLGTLIDNGNTGAEDSFDNALDEDFNTDTAIGIDVGVLWINTNYRLGATINNINEPSFGFGDISNIGEYSSAIVRDQIQETNTYTMTRQITIEGAAYTENQNWVISAALDLNGASDALGDVYQWATLSAAYATDTWYIPGARIGIRQNMSGTKIKYLTGGLSFGVLNLDVAYSTESITIDGSSVPRGAIFNLGLEVTF